MNVRDHGNNVYMCERFLILCILNTFKCGTYLTSNEVWIDGAYKYVDIDIDNIFACDK